LQRARDGYYAVLDEAHAAGVSISAIARAIGVSRQRAQQLLRRRP
jgi:plasmid maintenance system antidote protein VapI